MATSGRKAKRITIEEMKEILKIKGQSQDVYLAADTLLDDIRVLSDLCKIKFSFENVTFMTNDFNINAELGFFQKMD